MAVRNESVLIGSLLLLVTGGMLLAHPDDPKGLVKRVPYVGPGYRSTAPAKSERFLTAVEGAPLEFPASGVRLLSWLPLGEFGSASSGNDCWGYVSGSGREYAIMGLQNGTGFVEITDPGNPQILTVIAGVSSTWRDIKTYQNYAYSVTEGGGGGIQVIDLSLIDSGTVTLVNTITEDIPDAGLATGSSHNVAIDEDSGYLYRCGGGNNGLRIYSLLTPSIPLYVGAWSDRYIHDAQIVTYTSGPYADKQIAFCCSGFNGGSVDTGLDILDVTNKGSIINLSNLVYAGGAYSHQAWLSPDRTFLYLNDESDETSFGIPTETIVFNVTDLALPVKTTSFTNSSSAIGHNLYTMGNLIFEANYRSGVRIFDATNPLAPVETAYFDTWPEDDTASFNGLWSVYPYFPSGTFIGSDLEKGLFVWELGSVEMSFDLGQGPPASLPPEGGSIPVSILEQNGGLLEPGTPMLHYSTGGAFTSTPMTSLGGDDYEADFPTLDCFSTVSYYFSALSQTGVVWRSPTVGELDPYSSFINSETTVEFSDDFESDLGWSVTSDPGLTTGAWERGIPINDGSWGDPTVDVSGIGQCYVTENSLGNADVDGGGTTLHSPALDATGGSGVAYIGYYRWFSETAPGSDAMVVELANSAGGPWMVLETVTASEPTWTRREFRIDEYMNPTNDMRIRFTVGDFAPSLLEAGVDEVEILFHRCFSPGDADGDGIVGVFDLIDLLAQWGACPASCSTDFDQDGFVDVDDLISLLANWSP